MGTVGRGSRTALPRPRQCRAILFGLLLLVFSFPAVLCSQQDSSDRLDQWKQQIETLTAVVQAMPDESPEKEALAKRAQSAEASFCLLYTSDAADE